MKKGYIIGMVLAVFVITLGILALANKENGSKSVNSQEIATKIEAAAKAIDTYYGEIKVTGAVGDKQGAYLVKQWYKKGKLYSENYINVSTNKKQQLKKNSISLKDNNQTTIYNIDSKNAIITKTTTDKTLITQDSNFLQFPIDIIKNPVNSKVTVENGEYTFDINKDEYGYKVKYNKDTLLPIKVDMNYKNKFISSIEFKKLTVNPEIKDTQFSINIPAKTKIYKRNYSNESTNLEKVRGQVNYPVLTPSFLPKDIVLDKVSKEVIDTVEIVNLSYKGSKNLNVVESVVNKEDKTVIPQGLKKVMVGKYSGYQSTSGKNLCISWKQGKTAITIYSDLDSSTLIKIAASFN